MFGKKKAPQTMAEVQSGFVAQSQAILDAQTKLAETEAEKAIELARKADEAKAQSESHTNEANKAKNFIDKISAMFD